MKNRGAVRTTIAELKREQREAEARVAALQGHIAFLESLLTPTRSSGVLAGGRKAKAEKIAPAQVQMPAVIHVATTAPTASDVILEIVKAEPGLRSVDIAERMKARGVVIKSPDPAKVISTRIGQMVGLGRLKKDEQTRRVFLPSQHMNGAGHT